MGVWRGPDIGAPAPSAGISQTGTGDGEVGRRCGAQMEHEADGGG
jgi:hypothetical protein